jgi:hypothetical protein
MRSCRACTVALEARCGTSQSMRGEGREEMTSWAQNNKQQRSNEDAN